jgi:hypothetical protein
MKRLEIPSTPETIMNPHFVFDRKNKTVASGFPCGIVVLLFGPPVSLEGKLTWDTLTTKSNKIPNPPLEVAFSYSMKCTCCQRRAYEEWKPQHNHRRLDGRVLRAVPDTLHGMGMRSHALPILEDDRLISRFIDEIESKEPQIDGAGCS